MGKGEMNEKGAFLFWVFELRELQIAADKYTQCKSTFS